MLTVPLSSGWSHSVSLSSALKTLDSAGSANYQTFILSFSLNKDESVHTVHAHHLQKHPDLAFTLLFINPFCFKMGGMQTDNST